MKEINRATRLQEKLKIKDFKLNALLEVTNAINLNLPVDDLIARYREFVVAQLGLPRMLLFNLEGNKWSCLLQEGITGVFDGIDAGKIFSPVKGIQLLPDKLSSGFDGLNIIIPVFHQETPLAYLILGDTDEDQLAISPVIKHMSFLQTLTNILVVAIENKRMVTQLVEREKINRELELAAEMQSMLVASRNFNTPYMEVDAIYQPHMEMGGDYYEIIPMEDGKIAFCLGDVSGKGVSAAFLMANFQAYLRALLQFTSFSIEDLFRELNKKIVESVNGDRFITFFLGIYNPEDNSLQYINAGHLPPVIYDGNTVKELDAGCVGLGMLNEIPCINKGIEKLNNKPCIISLYTDGVTEIENEAEEEFGLSNLVSILQKNFEKPIPEINRAILSAIEQHRGKNPYFDDTTLLTIRIK